MLDYQWMIESHRLNTEEHNRYHRLRATWAEREPVARPREYRRKVAALLLALANRLDPRTDTPAQAAWTSRRPTRAEAMMLVGLPLHRVSRG